MAISAISTRASVIGTQAPVDPDRAQTAASPTTQTAVPTRADSVSVSGAALAASDLLKTANELIEKELLEPFSGYNSGNVSVAAYIDIGKYNRYILDQAASNMVNGASKTGVALKKEDVIEALLAANPRIASLSQNEPDRQAKLGPASVLADLSGSDMSNLTDMYIKAKEKGLDTSQVEVLAARMGIAARDQKNGVITYIYDPEKEKTGYGSSAVTTKADKIALATTNELSASGVNTLGMSDDALSQLLLSAATGSHDEAKTLNFVRKLLA